MEENTSFAVSLICAAVLALLLIPAPATAADTGEAVDIVQLPPLIFRTGYCGDGNCDGTETCSTCPADCGECAPEEIPLGMRALVLVPLAILALYISMKRRKVERTW